MAIRMGYWDCPGCERTKIEGPERQCPDCGRPRDTDIRFYTTDDAPEVTDASLLARARAGADWQCPYCSADNVANATQCVGCGASVDGAEFREQKYIPDQPPPAPPAPARTSGGAGKILGIVLAAVVLLGIGVWALFIRAKPHEVEVASVEWVKTLEVERLTTERKSAWADALPAGAREVSRTSKDREKKVQDGFQKVKVGKKDLGNGMFEDVYEKRPKYVTKNVKEAWVTYELERWKRSRTLTERRSDGSEPPEPRFVPAGRERAGRRDSRIVLGLRGPNGESYTYDADPKDSRARSYAVGQKLTAMVNAVGSVTRLE